MNAIISLCHFCELHGPSILFCTQAFHSHEPQQVLEGESSLDESGNIFSSWSLERERDVRSPTLGGSSSAPSTPTTPTPTPSFTKNSDMCEACRSFPAGQPGFISNDNEAKVSYISSQHPHHPQVFSMVRQACVRSLSCEVCPGREGPIFFGDDHRGHVLSYTFFIKDSQARGFQRWYSIIVVMMDKIYLLNSWPFLVSHLKSVIEDMQAKALAVYEDEQAKCPQRAHRLVSLTMSMNPSNFLQQRGGNKPARSLIELTKYKKIFCSLHKAFTWVLKVGGNRLTERLLEGPPTEDSIIDLEKQEETEEGFVKLFSKKDVVEEQTEEGDGEAEEDDEDPDSPCFFSLRHVIQVLGGVKFHDLAHHVVIGNQVIIRSKQKKLIRSLIDCLKNLLPRGCCRAIYYSDKYEDSWRCNFLGLPLGTSLPSHATLYVTIDIYKPDSPEAGNGKGTDNAEGGPDSCDITRDDAEAEWVMPEKVEELRLPGMGLLDPFIFEVNTLMHMPEKGPAVLMKMERALMNQSLSDSVVDHALTCLKEEWMNKVKVLFKFTKAGGNRSDEDTRKLLQVVGAQDEDKAVLKFWMTGLSVQYRNHMLSSAIQQTVGY